MDALKLLWDGSVNNITINLFSELVKLMELCLFLPISVAGPERSFSMLHRLKTWVRNSMTESRLTHLALMHVHQQRLDELDCVTLIHQFVASTPERLKTCGHCGH